jgi:hypothetical protein
MTGNDTPASTLAHTGRPPAARNSYAGGVARPPALVSGMQGVARLRLLLITRAICGNIPTIVFYGHGTGWAGAPPSLPCGLSRREEHRSPSPSSAPTICGGRSKQTPSQASLRFCTCSKPPCRIGVPWHYASAGYRPHAVHYRKRLSPGVGPRPGTTTVDHAAQSAHGVQRCFVCEAIAKGVTLGAMQPLQRGALTYILPLQVAFNSAITAGRARLRCRLCNAITPACKADGGLLRTPQVGAASGDSRSQRAEHVRALLV